MLKHTIFTPVYNRADRMYELYTSIKATNYSSGLEWVIIDDGSTDNIREVIELIKKDANVNAPFLQINCVHKENGGIHSAVNAAIRIAKGEYVTRIDSDDTILPDAFVQKDRLLDSIPEDKRDQFVGVVGICLNKKDMTVRGDRYPQDVMDSTGAAIFKKYKIRGDRNFCMRTEIMRQFPSPEHKDTHCVPEVIVWRRIDKYYLTRYTNVPMAVCEEPNPNSVTGGFAIEKSPRVYLSKYYGAIYAVNEQKSQLSFIRYLAMYYLSLKYARLSKQRTLKDVLKFTDGFGKKALMLLCALPTYLLMKLKGK